MIKRLLLFLAFSMPLLGQSPVTINGTVSDAGGNPATSGTVVFDISPQSSSIQYYVPGIATLAPQEVTCNIQSNGSLMNVGNTGPCAVWGNDLISPANTTYTLTFNPNGVNTNQVAQECIATPGPYNIDNPVFCPVVSIIPQYSMITAPVIQGNLIPSTNGVYTFGNSQAFYANIYTHTITFQASANGVLIATNGALSFGGTLPGGPFCALAGCTFTGQITLPGGGTGNEAATVDQVNSLLGAYLPLAGGTLSGSLFGTSASFSAAMNVGTHYFINSVQLQASDLSNGVSGSGAICLVTGSACSGTVTSVGLTSSNTNWISVAGSPVTHSGTLAMTINALGTDTKLVTGGTAGAAGTLAVWDALGGISVGGSNGPSIIRIATAAGCTTPVGTGQACDQTITWANGGFPNSTYTAVCGGSSPFTSGSSSEPFAVDLTGWGTPTNTTINVQTTSKGSDIGASFGNVWCIGVE